MSLNAYQGTEIVHLSRRTLESFVSGKDRGPRGRWDGYLAEKRGVFVTLKTLERSEEKLRGCIGFPYPVKPLGEAILEATVSAASEDPRFPPVRPEELMGILVEVSALTKPEVIRVARKTDLPAAVRVGVDGLIVSNSNQSGLLLPQVAIEFALQPADFLCEACVKAGLLPDSWLTDAVTVQKFQAEIFSEVEPGGAVKQVRF